MDKIVLRVEGMACRHWELAIQSAVRNLPDIKKGLGGGNIGYE